MAGIYSINNNNLTKINETHSKNCANKSKITLWISYTGVIEIFEIDAKYITKTYNLLTPYCSNIIYSSYRPKRNAKQE